MSPRTPQLLSPSSTPVTFLHSPGSFPNFSLFPVHLSLLIALLTHWLAPQMIFLHPRVVSLSFPPPLPLPCRAGSYFRFVNGPLCCHENVGSLGAMRVFLLPAAGRGRAGILEAAAPDLGQGRNRNFHGHLHPLVLWGSPEIVVLWLVESKVP